MGVEKQIRRVILTVQQELAGQKLDTLLRMVVCL